MSYNPKIFKAYDIRGIYRSEIDEDTAYRIGQGYAKVFKPTKPVVVGRDVRISAPKIQSRVIQGLVDAGVSVINVGLVSTDMFYFAVGYYKYGGGLQVTASHNPAEYIGVKIVKEGVVPVSEDDGLLDIKKFVESRKKIDLDTKGTIENKIVTDDLIQFIQKKIGNHKFRSRKIVYNPNFGYQGILFKSLVEKLNLPFEIIPLNERPDGTFPKGRPDPFIPENRIEFSKLVKSSKADLGVTWDADADRIFFCTNGGVFVDAYYSTTILIEEILKKNPNEMIVYDPRYTWAQIDAIKKYGGIPVISKVGHSFIKTKMRQINSIFSGESSGHTFYRDYWFAESGILPLIDLLKVMDNKNTDLLSLVNGLMNKYIISGEINSEVQNKENVFENIIKKYYDAKISKMDGVSLEYSNWRANIRASNTEPLMRLNVESRNDKKLMEEKRYELIKIIRGEK